MLSRHPRKYVTQHDEEQSMNEAYRADGWSDDDEAELLACPECGAEIYEEAERCPVCGNYIVHETNVWAGRPTWWIVLGLAGILSTILALSLGALLF
jgi:hypothetical protein